MTGGVQHKTIGKQQQEENDDDEDDDDDCCYYYYHHFGVITTDVGMTMCYTAELDVTFGTLQRWRHTTTTLACGCILLGQRCLYSVYPNAFGYSHDFLAIFP